MAHAVVIEKSRARVGFWGVGVRWGGGERNERGDDKWKKRVGRGSTLLYPGLG